MAIWTDETEPISVGPFFFKIDDTFYFLIDNTYRLLIEPTGNVWTDQAES